MTIVREKTIIKRPPIIGPSELQMIDQSFVSEDEWDQRWQDKMMELDDRYVNTSGDTMTGDLTIEKDSGLSQLTLKVLGTVTGVDYPKLLMRRGNVERGLVLDEYNRFVFQDTVNSPRIETLETKFIARTTDPSLTSGLLWFRSDLGRLRFSPDGTEIQEFVNRFGDDLEGIFKLDGRFDVIAGSKVRILGASGLDFQGGDVTGTGNVVDMDWNPKEHNTYDLGLPGKKWKRVCAVTTNFGDIGFSETSCAECGKPFKAGDKIVLKVKNLIPDEEGGGINCVPVHESCPA